MKPIVPTIVGKRLPQPWRRQSVRRIAGTTLAYTVLLLGSAFVLIPFLWAVSASFKSLDEVYHFPPQLLPGRLHWENYRKAVSVLPFPTFLANSVMITGLCVIGQVITGALVAFSFARLRWPGRDFLFLVLLSTMMLPGQVTMIPHFILYTKLGWVGTFLPLIVPSFFGGAAVYIFLMRQFFKTIPLELEDAARIDGCGSFGVFTRVILPLSRPVLATVAILSFIAHWHDFMGPLIYLDRFDKYTLQIGLRMFQDMYGTFMHYLMAASILVLLPVLVIFFLGQRYFVRGIVLTGLKG